MNKEGKLVLDGVWGDKKFCFSMIEGGSITKNNFDYCFDRLRENVRDYVFGDSSSFFTISAEHPSAKDYEIFYKGEKLNDVTSITRYVK